MREDALEFEHDHDHIVQFYDDQGFLTEKVAQFLAAGLGAGNPAVVIATEAHRQAFAGRLKLAGIDVEAACAREQLVLLDARATLAEFMIESAPDWERFNARVGGLVAKVLARSGQTGLRAYGEMVDLLWRDGNRHGAITLEGFWNRLATQHSFSLLCAYVMGNFYNSSDADQFRQVCHSHSHVIPAEGYSRLAAADTRLREISALQQRACSLESEIEHRKDLESALREALAREAAARAEAERNVHFNEMFAAMLGHDLRNPLGAITMGAHYITRIGSGEKTTKAAARILSSSERMSRMIDQLLDFTRIRVGGGLALNYSRIDLVELCSRIKEELEAFNPDCVITLENEADAVGHWDYDRLLQVFSNLVSNAINHGADTCRISILTDGNDLSEVVVHVHNEGTVEPEVLPVIFEPFRGSKRRLKTQGLGLGLYITKQIVMAHGGSIAVSSKEHHGTTMSVRLPRVSRS